MKVNQTMAQSHLKIKNQSIVDKHNMGAHTVIITSQTKMHGK